MTPPRCAWSRHRRQTGRAGAAQCLQQEGFRLVTPVVRQQHQIDVLGQRHLGQRRVAFTARPGLDAVAAARRSAQAAPLQADRQPPGRPALCLPLQVQQPVVGLRQQTVVYMQAHDLDRLLCRCHPGCGVPQRRGVGAAADGHADAPAGHGTRRRRGAHDVSAPWCR